MRPRKIDRTVSFLVYLCFGGFSLWAGSALINQAIRSGFYEDFVLGWERAVMVGNRESLVWPDFKGGNHLEHMQHLVKALRKKGINIPASNGKWAFQYVLDSLWYPEEEIFLLSIPGHMVFYGISFRTFRFLDLKIDGRVDQKRGRFTGEKSKDGFGFIGRWRI